jgi:hypothetical protein
MRILLLFAALSLASCAQPDPPAEKPTTVSQTGVAEPKPDTPEACVKNGGTYRRVCLMGSWSCVMPYSDAGKPCADKKECQGQCRYVGEGEMPPPGTAVTGACQRTTDPCGCFGIVADGKLQSMLCVD